MEEILKNTKLFQNIDGKEIQELLKCINHYIRKFDKGDFILKEGDTTDYLGVVLKGRVIIERADLWGNNTILGSMSIGEVFAETYAALEDEALMINVLASEECEILFINIKDLIKSCPNSCTFHTQLISNLVTIASIKNLNLSRKILHTGPKTIRGRLLSYFSECVKKSNSLSFSIVYNRQQLADYLSVDRSAMSNELSKMKNEEIIDFNKNHFTIIKDEKLFEDFNI